MWNSWIRIRQDVLLNSTKKYICNLINECLNISIRSKVYSYVLIEEGQIYYSSLFAKRFDHISFLQY